MVSNTVQPASTTLIIPFTDLEGSTRLWQEHPLAMQTALARHDEIIRTAVRAFDGRVIKSTGYGFYAVFESALDGLNACIAAQKRLIEESWPETGQLRCAGACTQARRRRAAAEIAAEIENVRAACGNWLTKAKPG